MNVTSATWCGLQWTPWIPFSTPSAFKQLPSSPGLYRIRVINGEELFYIGETGRNLRERLGDLRRNTMKDTMPYNDPHTAAPSLWAWRHAEQVAFECSVAPLPSAEDKEEAKIQRKGLEYYVLWQYRLEFGTSTRCNHGRFHPRYVKSTDRRQGVHGHRLPDEAPANPAGGPSLPPLHLLATPADSNWMGLVWSPFAPLDISHIVNVASSPGAYRLFDAEAQELLYIGESSNVRQRLMAHARKAWGCSQPLYSYVSFPESTPAYQRREIENDLIAGFYAATRRLPRFQLLDHH
jgi:hypothetical protein